MKAGKHLRGILVAAVTLSFAVVANHGALAQTADPNEILMTTTQNETATTTLQDRLTRRKEAFTQRLTTAQTTRLRARCTAAQTKLNTVSERFQTARGSRQTAYENIQTRLSELVTDLEGKVDTEDLEAALLVLDEKVAAFTEASDAFKQTTGDLGEMGCTDDPTAFRASLEAAKTEHAAVKAAAQDIRTYIQETIKPILQAIRAELVAKEAE